MWFIQKQTEERNPVIEIHPSSSAKAQWPLWISCFTTFIMWEKAAVFFHILFWKFLKKGKIKDKQRPLEFTDHRSGVLFPLNRDHEDYCFHFLNRFAFLFVPFTSRDSFSHCYLGSSCCSSGVALPVPDLNDLSLEGRAGLILRKKSEKDTAVFNWDYPKLFQCFWHCSTLAVVESQKSLCQVCQGSIFLICNSEKSPWPSCPSSLSAISPSMFSQKKKNRLCGHLGHFFLQQTEWCICLLS